jgi:ABC-type transport system involved in multi-copper enzyme maturation permease subunit
MNLRGVSAVVCYSLIELSRRRFLIVFVALGLATSTFLELIASALMDQPVLGQDRTAAILMVLAGIGPAAHSPAAAFSPASVLGVCAFAVGMVIVNHDLDSGAAVSILAKPISRAGYAAGKAVAAATLLFGFAAFMGLCISALIALNGQNETGIVMTFFIANAGNLLLLMLIVMALTIYVNNIVAAVIAFVIGQVVGLLEPLHSAVSAGDISDPFWTRIINGTYAVEPIRLSSAMAHEAVAVNLRVGLLRAEGNPIADVPATSGIGDVAVWLIYLMALCGLFVLVLRHKQI